MIHTYTVINHVLLKQMQITANEYIILDIIYHLSDKGYCYASKQYMADCLGLSKSAVENIIHKLVEQNFISTKDKTIKYLKTTQKFILSQVVETDNKVAETTTQVVESTTQVVESTTNSNIYINNNSNIINNIINKFSFLGESYKRFYKIKSYRDCITRLLNSHSEQEIVEKLNYALAHKDEQYAIQINTPFDLENKWDKIKVVKSESVDIDAIFNKYNK